MQADIVISIRAEVDPQKIKSVLNTEGMSANEAKKAVRRAVFKFLDEEYTDSGDFGQYTKEITEDIKDAIEELGLAPDSEDEPDE